MSDLQRAKDCAEKMYANDRASKSLGIEIEIPEAGSAIASMYVRQEMVNGFDICHGGMVFTLADTAFAFACNAYDEVTVAGSGNIEFLRPALRGERLQATAREIHRGRRQGVYKVEVHNQDNKLVALFQGRSVGRGEPMLNSE
ncbi:MAG: hydroxyphenylacetyl-CoA thioesterase PaaI [Woeseiaceae bacterium]